MAQIPISHYKDEDPNQTEQILSNAIDKEIASASTETPKLKVLPVNAGVSKNPSNIVNAFRQKLANVSTPVELPSIGKVVEFKDIDAKEQKELSKIGLESDSRMDVMYCAMVNMINRLACEKNFDIRDYTEFERIAITLNLQQMNKINPEIKYTCSQCGKENSYKLDTVKLLKKFNKSYKPNTEVSVEYGTRKFTFTLGWASVSSIEDFMKSYYKKYDNSSKSVKDTMNNLSQIEYMTMFIKKVVLEDVNDSEEKLIANLEDMKYFERVQILDCLPQSILFDDETGIISSIVSTFINPMNDCFKYNDCAYCGAEQTGTMANVADFIGA